MIQNSAKGSFDPGGIKQKHKDQWNREYNETTCFSYRQEQRQFMERDGPFGLYLRNADYGKPYRFLVFLYLTTLPSWSPMDN